MKSSGRWSESLVFMKRFQVIQILIFLILTYRTTFRHVSDLPQKIQLANPSVPSVPSPRNATGVNGLASEFLGRGVIEQT